MNTAPTPPTDNAPLTLSERRRLQKNYDQAARWMAEDSYDRDAAHRILLDCVHSDPGNAVYITALLENLRRKFPQSGRGGGWSLFSGKGGLKKAASGENWAEVFRQGPEILGRKGFDPEILLPLADACRQCDFAEAELAYLRAILETSPEEVEAIRRVAHAMGRTGHFEEAVTHWRKVEKLDPYDDQAAQMISVMTLEKCRAYDGSDPPPEDDDDATATAELDPKDKPKKRELVLTRRQELEQQIVNHPEGLENYLELADLLVAEKRIYDAYRTLTKAAQISSDLEVTERLEDVTILRARQQIEIAKRRATEEPTAEAYELVERLSEELSQLELETAHTRSERYPHDLQKRYQLGLRFKERGSHLQAAGHFEACLADADRQAEASLEIGECLQHLQKFPEALQHYRQAVQWSKEGGQDQLECRMLALYRAGVLAEAMQLGDSAEQYFQELTRLDADYKDAADRLDKLRQIEQNT